MVLMIKNITLFQIEDFLFHFVNLELHLRYTLACRTMTEKRTCFENSSHILVTHFYTKGNWVQFFNPLIWDNFLTDTI